MAKHSPRDSENVPPTSPSRYAETPPPPSYSSGDYSYTVELVAAIQNQLGKLTQAVETLTKESTEARKKVDKLSHIVYAAGVVATIFTALAGFVASKIADAVIATLKTSGH